MGSGILGLVPGLHLLCSDYGSQVQSHQFNRSAGAVDLLHGVADTGTARASHFPIE
jgi:hypothetical protein